VLSVHWGTVTPDRGSPVHTRVWLSLSLKKQVGNNLGFVDHTASATPTKL
jgi:hypothetical protein